MVENADLGKPPEFVKDFGLPGPSSIETECWTRSWCGA
jgi:hypothetical protein